jgi:hypothetical protein
MDVCNFHFPHCPNQITEQYPHYTSIISKLFGIRHSPTTSCKFTQTILSNEPVQNRSPLSCWPTLYIFHYNTPIILLNLIKKFTSLNLSGDTGLFILDPPGWSLEIGPRTFYTLNYPQLKISSHIDGITTFARQRKCR